MASLRVHEAASSVCTHLVEDQEHSKGGRRQCQRPQSPRKVASKTPSAPQCLKHTQTLFLCSQLLRLLLLPLLFVLALLLPQRLAALLLLSRATMLVAPHIAF